MKVSVLQEDLSRTVSLVSRFVSSRAQLPVLANILLSAKKGRLLVSATNLEMGISIWLGAKVEKEGSTTIPARLITEIVASLTPERVDFEEKEGNLIISSGSFSSTLSTISASEFPNVPESLPKERKSIKKDVLAKIAEQVSFAASQDETKPVLSGVLFLTKQGKTRLVATDGFRLSQKEISQDAKEGFPEKLIIPARAILELSKILPEPDEGVGIWVSQKENQVLFGSEDIVLTARLLEGEFPDFEKIIPGNFVMHATLEKEALLQAVRLSSVFARETANVIKLSFSGNKLTVSAESPQAGTEAMSLEVKKEGEDMNIAFNWRYLLDFLSSVSGEDVTIELSGQTSPAVFRDPKDASFLHLIMPIRIQV